VAVAGQDQAMAIALDHDIFRTTVANVAHRADLLSAARCRIGREVDGLLDGGWSGVAADSFSDAWTEWWTAAGDVVEGLAAMAQLLDAVEVDLTGRDLDAQAAVGRVADRLGSRLG
jgi:WXG100 family type VII secretion target